VTLSGGQGRRVVLEVYAPAAQGGEAKAAVESVQTHATIVVNQDGVRRGYDLCAMAGLEPLPAHVLGTSTISQ
jgi:hypothetical protein